jgi:DNA-binding transcriptional MerR regulator/methylmalonyl-CoA mutase cobalamin-binding subunit
MSVPASNHLPLSISAVERDTGLSKDTLRMWERRYRFPQPARDIHGERIYPRDQVEKLRTIKRLMDRGQRPGKLVALPLQALQDLCTGSGEVQADAQGEAPAAELLVFLDLIKSHRVAELRQQLSQGLMRQGLHHFLTGTVGPLNQQVGDAWRNGQFQIFEEHLYTEALQGVLRTAISAMPEAGRPPRILLSTLPGEQHNLGLLMAEAMFALDGATCISLGTQTPVWDIALAARAQNVDIVAISFSAAFAAAQVGAGLQALRDQLPDGVEVWAGGSNPGLRRGRIAGLTVLDSLDSVAPALANWRAARHHR